MVTKVANAPLNNEKSIKLSSNEIKVLKYIQKKQKNFELEMKVTMIMKVNLFVFYLDDFYLLLF
jgi:hypothetical protein